MLVCLSIPLAAAVVGMRRWRNRAPRREDFGRREVYTGASKAESAGAQMRAAESSTELHLAHLLLQEAADQCDVVADTGERLTIEAKAELK
ncbi:MAG: hypothetical protein R2710_18895 [Acidimicrobiales bacterium]